MTETLSQILDAVSGFLWGPYCLIPMLAGAGVYLTLGLRAYPWRKLPDGFRALWLGRTAPSGQDGTITPFQALMTALAATVGTGNIAGVATAIHFGGPGAVFWMWVIALFGMATKYAEAVLAVHFRERQENGEYAGGPMYYIRKGMGARWAWLAAAFAACGMVAAFGIGNMVQANSVADVLSSHFEVAPYLTGFAAAAITGTVIIGGVTRIARVAAAIVPTMALLYFVFCIFIVVTHAGHLPDALSLIVASAFNTDAALGVTLWIALRWGFARGIFSNEAGLGSAAIAHGAARTDDPVRQGRIAMLGTFIDTLVICTLTALVILVTGVSGSDLQGAALSASAFEQALGPLGPGFISIALVVFAFTTIMGWSYYGERCAAYLLGRRVIPIYRVIWIAALFFGAIIKLELAWTFADIFNGLMAIPNLIALIALSPIVFSLTRDAVAQASSKRKSAA